MNMQTVGSVIGWVVTGAIAGYLASLFLRAERQGCFINIALGIAGAFVGGLVMGQGGLNIVIFGTTGLAGLLDHIIHAIIGAILILIAIEIIIPGKQLGVRRVGPDEGGRRRRRR
jgi:uncharacterized membrane protein YeaQ/YmgE (transglycosylase-associated protein family)